MNSHAPLPLFRDYPLLAERLPHVTLADLPTPVEPLNLGPEVVDGQVFIKRDDLSGKLYGGNKVRKLEFLLADALRRGAKEVITFGFAGSNHALATAIYARQLGLRCTCLLMPQLNAHYVRRNLLADCHYKARLVNVPNIGWISPRALIEACRSKRQLGRFPRFIPAGGSCPLGIIGYVNAAMELRDQIAAGALPEPDRIYVPLGSMGTAAGLTIGFRAAGLNTRVIPVRVIERRLAGRRRLLRLVADTTRLLRRTDPAFPRIDLQPEDLLIREDCLGPGYAAFTRQGVDAARRMGSTAGIVLNGAYSAKAFAALLADAADGGLDGKTVLFWNTYNSRELSAATAAVDYRQLPKAFHRYFEEDVQPLDKQETVDGHTRRTGGAQNRSRKRSHVVVADCPTYSVEHVQRAVEEALDGLGGLSAFVRPGQTVLLKPNLFTAHPPEHAVTTHPALVRQMIRSCADAGAGRIWVGDSPVGLQNEQRLWSLTGMEQAIAGTPAELKSWRTAQKPLTCGGELLAVPAWLDEVDVTISLPKLKAHSLTTLTCGMKNIYGLVSGPAKLQFHVQYPSPRTMSAFLVRVYRALKPDLTLADAVTAMEGNGPAFGRALPIGVLLAGRDAVALDAVACRALRIAPSSVSMLRLAAEQELGCMEDGDIDCSGSGLPRLEVARMRPSLSRFLKWIPESFFRLSTVPWQLRPRIVPRVCIKCGNCIRTCPKGAIRAEGRRGYPQIRQKDCIACFCCMESCPEGAIALQVRFASLLRLARRRRGKDIA